MQAWRSPEPRVKREYVDYDPSHGHPTGEDLYYECILCRSLVSSLPSTRIEMCLCGNLRKDMGRLGCWSGGDKAMRLVRISGPYGTDVNSLLKLYLGADENGGYIPLNCEERLKRAFPDRHEEIMQLIVPYLEEDRERDWRMDFLEDTHRFETMLRQKFPELDAISARALANRWSFRWK
jgi:hypothetical protein